MRLIVRKERPHPGAQLRITDLDGHRITAFVTNATRGQLADLELRHPDPDGHGIPAFVTTAPGGQLAALELRPRRRAPAEDRIRAARTLDWPTCRCTTSLRTRSGARSWRSPAT